jgi:hypothetical protein
MGTLETPPSEDAEVAQVSRRITETQTWLRGAKAVESFDLAAKLEGEIAELEERHRRLLNQKTRGVAEEQRADPSEPVIGESLRPTVLSFSRGTEPHERIGMMWERLIPEDLERARHEVERQRIDTLARHAEELQSLEAEGTELDSLEQAIEAFMRKFGPNAVTA